MLCSQTRGLVRIMEEIVVFYSWQSDLPKETTENAIRICLKQATAEIEKQNCDIKFNLDEATRNYSGCPDIPSTIFEKIQKCDIFIADLSTISEKNQQGKKTPNPNVLIELGFAIKSIGWERILLMFNKEYGVIPDDIPFDISKNRITPFKISDKNDLNGFGQLKKNLEEGIKCIIDKNPKHLFSNNEILPEEKRRKNDIEAINNYLLSINIPIIDALIDDLPFKIDNRIFYFFEDFCSKIDCNYYYLYDNKIKKLFYEFKDGWEKCLSYPQLFDYSGNTNYHNLTNDQYSYNQQTYEVLCKNRMILKRSFSLLLEEIRNNWIEIDVQKKSDEAWNIYIEWNKKISRYFGEIEKA